MMLVSRRNSELLLHTVLLTTAIISPLFIHQCTIPASKRELIELVPIALRHPHVLLWVINMLGGQWEQGIVPDVDGTLIFARYLPNFGRGGTDVAPHVHVAVLNPDHQQKCKARGYEMD